MGSGRGDRRLAHPGARAVRRRRFWAGTVVVVCVAADVWSVSYARAREPEPKGPVTVAQRVAVQASTGPAAHVDSAEFVPSSQPMPWPDAAAGIARQTSTPGVVEKGTGSFTVLPVPGSAVRTHPTTGRVVRYTLEIEGGLGVRPDEFTTGVVSVLTDARGWQSVDGVRFVGVSPTDAAAGEPPDLRITLASPDTTDRLCAPLETRGQVSCHNGGRVVLNVRRWVLGADAYGTDLAGYRTYLVNHEVGHGIGHPHASCSGKGAVAPIMMQQTYGLEGCTAWPWPSAKPA